MNNNQSSLFSLFMPKSSKETHDSVVEAKVLESIKDANQPTISSEPGAVQRMGSSLVEGGSAHEGTRSVCNGTSANGAPELESMTGEKNVPKLPSLFEGKNRSSSISDNHHINDEECGCGEEFEEERLTEEEQDALKNEEEHSDNVLNNAELAGREIVSAPDKKSPIKTEKKPEFNRGTFIAYAGKTISITKFFAEGTLATLELDSVRKKLESLYPELSKQRTHMDWDEKKNLICPIVSKGKKGSYYVDGGKGFFFKSQSLFDNMEAVNILAAKDGYYDVRENPIGVFVTKVETVLELDNCSEGFILYLPKIPDQLFSKLVSFFIDYSSEYEVEVLGVFYWDSLTLEYILDIPIQSVSKWRVHPEYKHFPPHIIKVAEVHSHNTMRANFSKIDDEDEMATMLYGVIGKLSELDDEICYELNVRAGAAGKYIYLEPGMLIDSLQFNHLGYITKREEYPLEWHKQVSVLRSMFEERGMVLNNDSIIPIS